jgi:CRP-like cAMP-binding protein
LPTRNSLLRKLLDLGEPSSYLLPELKAVSLVPNQVLYEQGDQIDVIYFPLDSVVSALGIMEDGTTVETAMIGCDSCVGMSSVLGSGVSKHWFWVSISGEALQLDAKAFERLFIQNEAALKILLGSYRALVSQVSQRCICNTRHSILERLACWLLMVHDRVGGANLRLTQETIASRIGARRAGITVSAGILQEMNAIEYRRGHVHIIDRNVLEEIVCECYATMRSQCEPGPFAVN